MGTPHEAKNAIEIFGVAVGCSEGVTQNDIVARLWEKSEKKYGQAITWNDYNGFVWETPEQVMGQWRFLALSSDPIDIFYNSKRI